MNAAGILIIIAVVGISIAGSFLGWNLPSRYRDRSCQGRRWRGEFPEVPKSDIREFLRLFVSGFAFREKDKLKFQPSDQLLEIYRTLYPSKWQADALEFETLAKLLRSQYGIDLSSIWRDDLTLGQLFMATRK